VSSFHVRLGDSPSVAEVAVPKDRATAPHFCGAPWPPHSATVKGGLDLHKRLWPISLLTVAGDHSATLGSATVRSEIDAACPRCGWPVGSVGCAANCGDRRRGAWSDDLGKITRPPSQSRDFSLGCERSFFRLPVVVA
jgi:hypothetical protein